MFNKVFQLGLNSIASYRKGSLKLPYYRSPSIADSLTRPDKYNIILSRQPQQRCYNRQNIAEECYNITFILILRSFNIIYLYTNIDRRNKELLNIIKLRQIRRYIARIYKVLPRYQKGLTFLTIFISHYILFIYLFVGKIKVKLALLIAIVRRHSSLIDSTYLVLQTLLVQLAYNFVVKRKRFLIYRYKVRQITKGVEPFLEYRLRELFLNSFLQYYAYVIYKDYQIRSLSKRRVITSVNRGNTLALYKIYLPLYFRYSVVLSSYASRYSVLLTQDTISYFQIATLCSVLINSRLLRLLYRRLSILRTISNIYLKSLKNTPQLLEVRKGLRGPIASIDLYSYP